MKRTYMRVGRDVDKMEVACDGLLTLQDSRCTTFTPEENIRHSDVKSTQNKVQNFSTRTNFHRHTEFQQQKSCLRR